MSAAEPQAPGSLEQSVSAVGSLRRAVEEMGLRLDPSAGEQIRSALEEQRSTVDGWLTRAEALARQAPLGQNPVGEAMATKFANRAKGDEHSFSGVLKRYREVLDEALDAVNAAMRTYRDADEHAADSFRKLV